MIPPSCARGLRAPAAEQRAGPVRRPSRPLLLDFVLEPFLVVQWSARRSRGHRGAADPSGRNQDAPFPKLLPEQAALGLDPLNQVFMLVEDPGKIERRFEGHLVASLDAGHWPFSRLRSELGPGCPILDFARGASGRGISDETLPEFPVLPGIGERWSVKAKVAKHPVRWLERRPCRHDPARSNPTCNGRWGQGASPLAAGGASMRNRGKQRMSPLWEQR